MFRIRTFRIGTFRIGTLVPGAAERAAHGNAMAAFQWIGNQVGILAAAADAPGWR
jgi:hypothetical protein